MTQTCFTQTHSNAMGKDGKQWQFLIDKIKGDFPPFPCPSPYFKDFL